MKPNQHSSTTDNKMKFKFRAEYDKNLLYYNTVYFEPKLKGFLIRSKK